MAEFVEGDVLGILVHDDAAGFRSLVFLIDLGASWEAGIDWLLLPFFAFFSGFSSSGTSIWKRWSGTTADRGNL